MRKPGRAGGKCEQFVKLFDDRRRRGSLDKAYRAEEAAVPYDTDDLLQICSIL